VQKLVAKLQTKHRAAQKVAAQKKKAVQSAVTRKKQLTQKAKLATRKYRRAVKVAQVAKTRAKLVASAVAGVKNGRKAPKASKNFAGAVGRRVDKLIAKAARKLQTARQSAGKVGKKAVSGRGHHVHHHHHIYTDGDKWAEQAALRIVAVLKQKLARAYRKSHGAAGAVKEAEMVIAQHANQLIKGLNGTPKVPRNAKRHHHVYKNKSKK